MHRVVVATIAGLAASAATAACLPGVSAAAGHRAGVGRAAGHVHSAPGEERGAHPGLQGIPSGAPPAAYKKLPALPHPSRREWPFPGSAFSHTSGTGRLAGGATFWSDFVYDAFGAAAAQGAAGASGVPVSTLAPTQGAYTYPGAKAHGDGADIFTAAVGLTKRATWWRVDWNTLADRSVPIAEWALDTDNNTGTGATAWPANAGVNSPGIDRALVVSGKGARLLDANSGKVLAKLPTVVDMRTRSFIVRVPRSVLPVAGTWRVRLAAGLSNAAGTAFAPADGAEPGQPNVYNVTFRKVAQEPPVYVPSGDVGDGSGIGLLRGVKYGNFWMEAHQADALAHSDVTAFSLPVIWSQLAHHVTTPEPLPRGYSARWYVTPFHFGQGIIANPSNSGTGDLRPNYLGRIQPYSVYVPSDYTPHRKFPLTWILHSLSVNYNQYGALDPTQMQRECEDRDSICATTEGFAPDMWYYDEAEVDFWDVWHSIAKTYTLDPERTVISGYSMGGWASYKLGLAYPDLFAKALPLAGPPGCGLRIAEGAGGAAGSGSSQTAVHCSKDGDSTPLVGNARWVPYVLGDGAVDELVPVSSVLQQVNAFTSKGLRIHFELYPAEDHLVFATQDGFSSEIGQLGVTRRAKNPGHITYAWYPNLTVRKWGIGPTGVYWIRGLAARDRKPGVLASLEANDAMRPWQVHVVKQHYSAQVPGDPSPAAVLDQSWQRKPARSLRRLLQLHLTDVAGLGVDLTRARMQRGKLVVTTDGATRLTLLHARPGSVVRRGGQVIARATHGRIAVMVGKGKTHLRIAPR